MWAQRKITIDVIKVYMPDTATEIVTDTLQFIPHKIPLPITKVEGHLKLAIDDIVTLLLKRYDTNTPIQQQYKQLAIKGVFVHIAKLLNNDIHINKVYQNTVEKPRVMGTISTPYVTTTKPQYFQ